MATYETMQHDLYPPLRAKLTDSAGTAVDLTNATSVTVHIFREDTRAQKVNAACTVDSQATSGWVEYEWQSGDTDTAGRFLLQFEVVWPTNKPQTYPQNGYDTLLIYDDLA